MKKLFLTSLFAASCFWCYAQKLGYDYPVKPGSAQWQAFNNTLDKVKACQIPDALLKNMPTGELLAVCLRYPLLYDYALSDSPYEGLMSVMTSFNGFQEFVNRPDAYSEWFNYYTKLNPDGVAGRSQLADRGFFLKDFAAVELMVAHGRLLSKLSEDDRKQCLKQLVKHNETKAAYKNDFGFYGDVTSAFIGRKLIKPLKEDQPLTGEGAEEKTKLKNIFDSKMLVASPVTVEEALKDIKEYVKTLK
jgi:hypothetical protein